MHPYLMAGLAVFFKENQLKVNAMRQLSHRQPHDYTQTPHALAQA